MINDYYVAYNRDLVQPRHRRCEARNAVEQRNPTRHKKRKSVQQIVSWSSPIELLRNLNLNLFFDPFSFVPEAPHSLLVYARPLWHLQPNSLLRYYYYCLLLPVQGLMERNDDIIYLSLFICASPFSFSLFLRLSNEENRLHTPRKSTPSNLRVNRCIVKSFIRPFFEGLKCKLASIVGWIVIAPVLHASRQTWGIDDA